MKFVKSSVVVVLLAVISIFVSGCGAREPMDVNVFRSVMEAENYEITDFLPRQAENAELFRNHLIVTTENYEITFAELIEDAYARNVFNGVRAQVENNRGSVHTSTTVNAVNHNMFEQTSGGVFAHIYRVDNTVLYVIADSEYRSHVRELIGRIVP